jgi:hypothetical protein
MSSPELQQILEAIEKPLLYTSQNDYAHLKTLKALEPYMAHWLEKASALPLSQRRQELIHRLRAQVKGFDGMDLALKQV